jgi:hypothetical protein
MVMSPGTAQQVALETLQTPSTFGNNFDEHLQKREKKAGIV